MIIDPKSLSADIAKLLGTLRVPAVPASAVSASPDPKTNAADQVEFSTLLKTDPQFQINRATLTQIATAVSYNQAFDGILLRLQKTLERMLTIAELSQNPSLSAAQRAAFASEFDALQQSLNDLNAKPVSRESTNPALSQQFALLYGAPIENGWKQIADRLRSEEQRRRRRSGGRKGSTRFPNLSMIVSCSVAAKDPEPTVTSILEQDYPELECVLLHQGGDPRAEKWGEQFGDRILRHAVSSPFSEALVSALQNSSGEIIGWFEAGDLLYPHSLQTMASVFLRNAQVEWASSASETGPSTIETLAGTFFRRSLWDRIEPLVSAERRPLPEAELATAFLRSTPLYALNVFLSGPTEINVLIPESSSIVRPREKKTSSATASLITAQPISVGAMDVYSIDPGQPIDVLISQLDGCMSQQNWSDAVKVGRLVAAADPGNADLFGLEAVCEYHLGRLIQAHALLRNVAARFHRTAA